MFDGLDIETISDIGTYALEPWRLQDGAEILSVSTHTAIASSVYQKSDVGKCLEFLQPELPIAVWNGVFDLSWLYLAGLPIDKYYWVDGMILEKCLDNAQETTHSRSLAAAAQRWISDLPWCAEFIEMKKNADYSNVDYLLARGDMDAKATAIITERIWNALPKSVRRAAEISMANLPVIARSYAEGILYDIKSTETARVIIQQKMVELEAAIGLPARILGSQKLGLFLYGTKGAVQTITFTNPKEVFYYHGRGNEVKMKSDKTGKPACDKRALTFMLDTEPLAPKILKWKELRTQLTKFINTPIKAAEYLGCNTLHPQPKLFNCYTGRHTYLSEI